MGEFFQGGASSTRKKAGFLGRSLIPFFFFCVLGSVAEAASRPGALYPAILFEIDDIKTSSFERLALEGALSFSALYDVPIAVLTPGSVNQRAQGADEGERLATALKVALQEGHGVVVGVGYTFSTLFDQVAPDHPGVRFIVLDNAVSQPNVQSLLFREEEGSYLVGALAGLASRTGTVGFVGGKDIPLIRKFGCAYAQGVLSRRPDARVLWRMTGTTSLAWGDPVRGAKLARELVGLGADVVFHAAGQTGDGVIEGAAAAGAMAIGVDSNQNGLAPGQVLTSLLKRTDVAVFLALKDLAEGRWQPGIRRLGLKEGAIDWALDENNIFLVSEQRQEVLDTVRFDILSGAFKVVDYDADGRRCPYVDFGPEAPDDP